MNIKYNKFSYYLMSIVFIVSFSVIMLLSLYHIDRTIENKIITLNEQAYSNLTNKTDLIENKLSIMNDYIYVISKMFHEVDSYNEDQISTILENHFLPKLSIFQLRLLDTSGQELIRFDLDKNSNIIKSNDLQNKSDRYYFKEAKQISTDAVYFSPFDLNVENGQIEEPYKNTTRAIKKIVINNQLYYLVVNYNLTTTFKNVLTDASYDLFLIEKDEQINIHLDDSLSFSKQKHTNIYLDDLLDYKNQYITKQELIHSDYNVVIIIKKEIFEQLKNEKKSYLKMSLFMAFLVSLLISMIILMVLEKNIKYFNSKALKVITDGVYINDNTFEEFEYILKSMAILSEEIQQKKQYITSILDSQLNFVVITDGMKLVDANRAMFDFFDYENIDTFYKEHDCLCDFFLQGEGFLQKIQNNKTWLEIILEDEKKTHKVKIKDIDNNIHIFQINLQPLHGEENLDVVNFTDITELSSLQDSLEEKVQKQLQQIILKDEAIEVFKAKSEFLANMSHEIRTPLNAIMGFIDLLREDELDTKKQNYLNVIHDASKNLLEIINGILDFSKIESGKLELNKVSFHPVKEFEMTKNLFKTKMEEKNILFSTKFNGLENPLYGDILRIKQVVNNLLSNAIKFTDAGKKIYLDVEYKNNILNISVEDEGIGITKEYQKTIFEAFSQADSSTTRRYGGTGLGLAISYNLIKSMGGELLVESTQGIGSKFYFSIAMEVATDLRVIEEKIQKTNFDELRLLLVEDNKANQMFMKVILKKMKIDFEVANNGVEAVEKFKTNKYNFILMDENMPIMNGIEATRQILQYEKENNLKHTVIIALTANALKGDRERFLAAGMDEYLTKPLKKEILSSLLNKLTQKGKL